ncbi:putative polysaccharide biosynthesis protein [Cytobacillus oceanisediminis]|uniref:PST family polysaccharide transporter n=1 Tax=Cytobacillus oceanisediminis TaxID=665099 RepID=A0A562J893_9BACI|nr:oligosaccharide flippase family protein [Cytobacillus oceanisediminis]TWH79164.1 PST family polysaccharide transporter [Cytobacillus oceanisediminis]
MKPVHTSGDLFKGAFILTIAALVTKILSAIYRVPFQNIVGDVGFYIYQQVYPFYGIILVLSTYGFPVVISKLYVEQAALKREKDVQNLFVISALVLTIIGFTGFSILYWGSDWLAARMNDPQLAVLLKVVAVVFLIFPIVSMLRGFFQGRGNMVPTAVSQVGEQLVRVVTILLAAFLLVREGYSLYIVGGGALFGAITGGFTAALILITFFYIKQRRNLPSLIEIDFKKSVKIAKVLIIQGFAICISSLVLIFIQLADSLNLYSLLLASGYEGEQAKELKGVYDRGQPIVQLGMVVATSMSLSLVPLISKEKMKNQAAFLHDKIRLALQISILVGAAATVGLWNIIEPANVMLFENRSGSDVLSILSLLIFLSSMIITITAILQGLGFILFPAAAILLGFAIKYGLNILLVPTYGTIGAAAASCLALAAVLLPLIFKLRSYLKISLFPIRFLFVICMAAVIMAIVLQLYLQATGMFADFEHDRLYTGFQALSAVVLGGFTYLFIVFKGNTFKEEELALLPFGSKLMFLLPKKNRR